MLKKSLILTIMVLTTSIAHAQELVQDPYPRKIGKSDTRIELSKVADGFVTPVWATHAGDNSGRLFVVDQAGSVTIIAGGQPVARPFLDARPWMVELLKGFDERGLLGLAFHPGFADSDSPGFRRLYTYTSEPAADYQLSDPKADNVSVLAEWLVSTTDPNRVETSTRRVVMTFEQPQFNHDGGAIAFGPDGLLYIGAGDGGAANDMAPGHSPQGNGQDLNTPLGKILRIDPLGRVGKRMPHGRYSIPDDNPLVGKKGLAEIYAWGLRNPYRISFDRETGELTAADVGQNKIEEINIIKSGGNYGWPIREASFFFLRSADKLGGITKTAPTADLPEMIDPVAEYDHDEGISITGGFVYRGKAIEALRGLYIFGDWSVPQKDATTGRLFAANLQSGEIQELRIGKDDRPLGGFVTGFGEDEAGELYILTNNSKGPNSTSGAVWKIIPIE